MQPPGSDASTGCLPLRRRVFWQMVWVVLAALALLTACKADATVRVDLAEDGSGLVEVALVLDDEAVDAVGGLQHQIRLDDLVDAGWTVQGPTRSTDDGLTHLRASKQFEVPERLPSILEEVAGRGVFDDMVLLRRRSFARTTWRLTGEVDLSGGLETFSDAGLAETLSGLPLGRTSEELEALAGCEEDCDPAAAFGLDLVVTMPGGATGNADVVDGATGTWHLALGDTKPTAVDLSGSVVDRAPRVWLSATFVAAGLLVLLGVFEVARRLLGGNPLRRVFGSVPRPARRTRKAAEIIEQRPQRPEEVGERRLELVVLGGVGVVWDGGTDPEGLLVSFVRDHGGIADPREVADRYRAASLGQVSSAEFWDSVDVAGDPEGLDHDYLSGVRLRPDVMEFLDQMARRGLTVACLTNAVLPWSVLLRRRFGLDDLIAHWVVSGEIGARKPGQAMFEALRRMSGVPFRNMLLVDSEIATLEAARTMGMSTVLMRGRALVPGGFNHPVIDGFADMFRQRPDQADEAQPPEGQPPG